jgi:FK506-binding protein 4/5
MVTQSIFEQATITVEEKLPSIDSDMIDISADNEKNRLFKRVLREGHSMNTPPMNSEVIVHYTGTLKANGFKFDSSKDRKEPFTFKLGEGSVIRGWDVGVATMKKGEVAEFLIHPEYGYGLDGSGSNIPPNAWLVFEIEMLDWMLQDVSDRKDRSLLRVKIVEGEGWETAMDGATVTANYTLYVRDRNANLESTENRTAIERRENVQFVVGDEQVVSFVEKSSQKVKKGGKSTFYYYPSGTIATPATLQYTVHSDLEKQFYVGNTSDKCLELELEVVSFVNQEKEWSMDGEQRLTAAHHCKEEGNEYFKMERLTLALKRYNRITELLSSDRKFNEQQKEESKKIKLAVYNNMAVVEYKMKNFTDVIKYSTKALEIQSTNVKALFKRAQAHSAKGDNELARGDLTKAIEYEPDNQLVKSELNKINQKLKDEYNRTKEMYTRMFQ